MVWVTGIFCLSKIFFHQWVALEIFPGEIPHPWNLPHFCGWHLSISVSFNTKTWEVLPSLAPLWFSWSQSSCEVTSHCSFSLNNPRAKTLSRQAQVPTKTESHRAMNHFGLSWDPGTRRIVPHFYSFFFFCPTCDFCCWLCSGILTLRGTQPLNKNI